jgi:hypothetical protein
MQGSAKHRGQLPGSASLLALGLALGLAPASFGHHSQAMFDQSREFTFEGTVQRLDWKNPHIYLIVATTDSQGQPLLQQIEGLAITQAQVDGLERDALQPGTRVLVRANPNRGGEGKTVRGLDVVTTADGKVHPFYQRKAPPLDLQPATSLAGKWAPSLSETGKAFGAVNQWPFTAAARAGQDPSGSCELEPVPFLNVINELRIIEVEEQRVVFRYNNSGDETQRIVYLDQSEHPADLQPSLHGHSIGGWDGETLVIDTIGYTPDKAGLFSHIPSGLGKHTVERLTLSADKRQLHYELSVADPEFLQGTATLSMLWDHRPDLELDRSPCDLEVSDRYLLD